MAKPPRKKWQAEIAAAEEAMAEAVFEEEDEHVEFDEDRWHDSGPFVCTRHPDYKSILCPNEFCLTCWHSCEDHVEEPGAQCILKGDECDCAAYDDAGVLVRPWKLEP